MFLLPGLVAVGSQDEAFVGIVGQESVVRGSDVRERFTGEESTNPRVPNVLSCEAIPAQ
ncbi:MAG: hypothetical protein GY878_00335 [Fuerstiella sp.]|nr:hypothetical protein [Fuerstiella sp.]